MITGQFEVEFTKDGKVFDDREVTALLDGLAGASDLLVIAHGWNNDMTEARGLYDDLTARFLEQEQPATGPGSSVVEMRVFWPSKKFADADLIPGGGAASAEPENDEALLRALEDLKQDPDRLGQSGEDPVRAANIDAAIATVGVLEGSGEARREFVLRIRAILDPNQAHPDDGSQEFFQLDPEGLFDRFGEPVPVELAAGEGGAANLQDGGAVFLGDLLSGVRAAARRIANFATYYQMKTRAGTVGSGGAAATLLRVRERWPDLPVHLVGHSFGGRLVTAAASVLPAGNAPVTVSLLQAAFSHNGFGEKFDGVHDGAFRTVLRDKRISGPILITHTKNDKAVGIAYPLASRIAQDSAAALGDENDPYGGMGRNGAQHTPEVNDEESKLRDISDTTPYAFTVGAVFNLNADSVIKDHGDVAEPPVARAVWQALVLR